MDNYSDHNISILEVALRLRFDGYTDIRLDHWDGFERPSTFRLENEDAEFAPDIMAVTPEKIVCIFEVETLESMDEELNLSRWKCLADYAQKNDHKFYLVVPKKQKTNLESMLEEHRIHAGIWIN